MERLKQMKERLIDAVETQINGCLETASAEELGEAVDMIKDLDEAIYYGTLTKAMEDKDAYNKNTYFYTEKVRPLEYPYERYELPYANTMYYGGNGGSSGGRSSSGGGMSGGRNYYHQGMDSGWGYQPVGQDITEMIQDASPEEKQMLQQKISMLATKIK